MTTINTTEDFLTLMRENQEFREAARQAILTEELLALPAVFSTFALEMRTDFRRLESGQKRLSDRVDSIRGTSLEQRLSTKLVPLLGREFNVRRVYPIWSPGVIDVSGNTREFLDRVEQALEDGIVDDDEEARLRVTDLVMRSQRKTDRSTLWFTVEASGIINDDDITRSQQSANGIRKIYCQDAIPVVYGYGIHEDQVRLAEKLGVQVYRDPEGN